MVNPICKTPNRIPGPMPPKNKEPTETPVSDPYSTIMILGGMIGPIEDEAAVIAAENLTS